MIISAKGRYALRAMIALAENGTEFSSLKEIAKTEDIPHKFLENVMTELTKAGLVESSRGKMGGYRLTRTPAEYTVADILEVTELSFSAVECTKTGKEDCPFSETCPTLPMWRELDETVNAFFRRYTLQSFLKK